MILGITGGSGSGKTTLLGLIAAQGGVILDCDKIYHELLQRDPSLLAAIGNAFPGTVQDGALDRKALGALVFSDKNALAFLNKITHAAVKKEVLARLESRPKLAAIDAIALFEGGLAELCDVTVAVVAPLEARVARLMARDRISEDYARKRLSAQHEDAWFREKCDHVLENSQNIDTFATNCLAFLRELGIMKEMNVKENTK